MSQRPRIAGDGRLLVPEAVMFRPERRVFVSHLAGDERDPFEWTEDRLLLAESFARLDLDDPPSAGRWFERHGIVDAIGLGAVHVGGARDSSERGLGIDPLGELIEVQATLDWELAALVRLSDNRDERAWDSAWGRVILDSAGHGLVIGGPFAGEYAPRDPEAVFGPDWRRYEGEVAIADATAGWPRLLLTENAARNVRLTGTEAWHPTVLPETQERSAYLGTTWEGTVDLLRLLFDAHVSRAVELNFTSDWETVAVDGQERRVLVPREVRVWRSILEPIHLQLFEALLRITEDLPGASTCRECGRPFLVLDARRRFYCNDRERFRHTQRERRRRLTASESAVGVDDATVVKLEDEQR